MKRLGLLIIALAATASWAVGTVIDETNRQVNGSLTVKKTLTVTGVQTISVIDAGLVKADVVDAGALFAQTAKIEMVDAGLVQAQLAKLELVDAGNMNVVSQLTVGGLGFFGVGANAAAAAAGGSVSIITADVTSSGASNLISYTLPANALNATNRCLRITGWGTALNNANAKTVALDFGAQTIISKILTVSLANTTWSVRAVVCRSGASTQDIYAEAFNPMGTAVTSVDGNTVLYQAARTAGTQTDTATIVIKGKTTTATTTDVTMDGLIVEFI